MVKRLHPEKRNYFTSSHADDRGRHRLRLHRATSTSRSASRCPTVPGRCASITSPSSIWIWFGCLFMALGGLRRACRPPLPAEGRASRRLRKPCPGRRRIVNRFLLPLGIVHRPGRLPRRRSQPRPARGALAAGRQAGAGLRGAATGRARQDLLAQGDAGQGLAAQRLGLVVRLLPRRSTRCWSQYRRNGGIPPVVGLNYKDQRADGMRWLAQFGDPYVLSAFDADGRVGIDYGVYGVPETYLIDKAGIIRYKQIGPITPEVHGEEDPAAGEGAGEMRILAACLAALLLATAAWAKEAAPLAEDPVVETAPDQDRRGTALPRLPERIAGRLARRPGRGPAPRSAQPDQAGQDRPGDQGLPGQPLRRLRALPATRQAEHLAALGRARSCSWSSASSS